MAPRTRARGAAIVAQAAAGWFRTWSFWPVAGRALEGDERHGMVFGDGADQRFDGVAVPFLPQAREGTPLEFAAIGRAQMRAGEAEIEASVSSSWRMKVLARASRIWVGSMSRRSGAERDPRNVFQYANSSLVLFFCMLRPPDTAGPHRPVTHSRKNGRKSRG